MSKVILKMDDLNVANFEAFNRVYNICKNYNALPSFGVIGNSLDEGNEDYISKLILLKDSGLELWNHGYFHEVNEFSENTYEQQLASINKTQKAFERELGFRPTIFGSPFNNSNEITTKVLRDNFEEINHYYFMADGEINSPVCQLLVRCNCEKVAGKIDLDLFSAEYNRLKNTPYFVLQTHPGKWKEEDYAKFEEILNILLEDENTFVTANNLFYSFAIDNTKYDEAINDLYSRCSNVFLYGAGEVGREMIEYLHMIGRDIESYIISDGQVIRGEVARRKVMYFSDFCEVYKDGDCGIIIAGSDQFQKELKLQIGDTTRFQWIKNIDNYNAFIDYIRQIITWRV